MKTLSRLFTLGLFAGSLYFGLTTQNTPGNTALASIGMLISLYILTKTR